MKQDTLNQIYDYYKSLQGTIRYETGQYIGFKVCGTMYSEVKEKNDFLSILVRRQYVTDQELQTLNIYETNIDTWTLDTELQIRDDEDIEPYKVIIKRAYDDIVTNYNKKIEEKINKAIEKEKQYFFEYAGDSEYAFEKLTEKYNEFITYKISNNELEEINIDFQSLDRFSGNDFLNQYVNNEVKYNFIKIIYELVAYIDLNAFNKKMYNEYEDNRTLALTFVRQNDWVKNLLSYKKYRDLSKVSEVVRNVLLYILEPEKSITCFVNLKIKKFLQFVSPGIEVNNNYKELCAEVYRYMERYNIEVANEKNRAIVYGRIMFAGDLYKEWDVDNNYWKVQPYREKNLSREEVEANLKNNILVTKENSIRRNATNNIFYVATDEGRLFLGRFIEEAKENSKGFFERRFEIIKEETENDLSILTKDKPWGSKYSSKTYINIKAEEKAQFEAEVINKLFGEDIDKIASKKIEYNPYVKLVGDEETDITTVEETDGVYDTGVDTSLNTILYGPPGTGKTYNTVNYAVSIIEKKEVDEIVDEAKLHRSDVFERYKKYLGEKRIVFTTFHQNYGYEDFIQGIKANTNNGDSLSFVKEDGVFKELVDRAKNDMDNNYVIVIDEINRGNISRIFGELITLIEEDKRFGRENETKVTLPSKEIFYVPANVFIVGTMNTADKSIALIDIALRRRFDFIPMYTDYTVIPEFKDILQPINKAIYDRKKNADYLIGHAFFVNKEKEEIGNIIRRKILPLLNEYFYGNENEIKDILLKGGIKVEQNPNTFQLEYAGLEE